MSKEIDVAIFGCGGVGQCIAQDLAKSKFVSSLVLADVNLKGPEFVKRRSKSDKIEILKSDGSDPSAVAKVADDATTVSEDDIDGYVWLRDRSNVPIARPYRMRSVETERTTCAPPCCRVPWLLSRSCTFWRRLRRMLEM